MTKDLMEFMGLEIEELCELCGGRIEPGNEDDLCEICKDNQYTESFDEGDNDYL